MYMYSREERRRKTMPKEKSECSIWWCENEHYALGLCKAHWVAVRRYGSPYGKHEPQIERLESAVLYGRLVAVDVLEFAQSTEFDRICPFCHEKDGLHTTMCAVVVARRILNMTSKCSEHECGSEGYNRERLRDKIYK